MVVFKLWTSGGTRPLLVLVSRGSAGEDEVGGLVWSIIILYC